jgi:hypothetical protein
MKYGKYNLHFVGGTVKTVSNEIYEKLVTRLRGLSRLEKPFEMDGLLFFPHTITFVEPVLDSLIEENPFEHLTKDEDEPAAELQPLVIEDNDEEAADEPTECQHPNLVTGWTEAKNGVKRYYPYCPDCMWKGTLMRHAEVDMDALMVDLSNE